MMVPALIYPPSARTASCEKRQSRRRHSFVVTKRERIPSLRISFSFLRLLSYCGSNQPNSRSLHSADCSFPLFSVTLRFSLPVLDSPLLSLVPYESSFPFFFYLNLLVPEGEFAFDITYAKKFVKVPTYCPLVAVECSFDDDRIISSYYTL